MTASELTPVGDVRLVPDWQTLMPLPYSPGHARVFSNTIIAGQPWALSPLGFLLRMTEEAKKEGLEIQTAFENESYLLQKNGEEIVGEDSTVFAATASMDVIYR